MQRILCIALMAGTCLALGVSASGLSSTGADAWSGSGASPAVRGVAASGRFVFPLKVSANRRYLVDQRNRPFMIIGDSPQAMIGNLTVKDAAAFIANRQAAGFNALWVNLLCANYTGCRDDGTTRDGIKPFTTPGDLSTRTLTYFARASAMIRLRRARGSSCSSTRSRRQLAGRPQEQRGQKGLRLRPVPGQDIQGAGNIVWMSGNDFQTWKDPADDAVVIAVAQGIQSVDKAHIHTVELEYWVSGSLDDARWAPIVKLDAAYTYRPTYAQVLKEYNRKQFMPVFMVEAGYEGEQNSTGNLFR